MENTQEKPVEVIEQNEKKMSRAEVFKALMSCFLYSMNCNLKNNRRIEY